MRGKGHKIKIDGMISYSEVWSQEINTRFNMEQNNKEGFQKLGNSVSSIFISEGSTTCYSQGICNNSTSHEKNYPSSRNY